MGKILTDVRLGRSTVKYGGHDLGFTEGEIAFTYTQEFRLFVPDQNTGAVKKFLLNEAVKATIPIAQTNARSLAAAKAFPGGELKATPVGGGGTTTLDADAAAGDLILSVVSETNFEAGDFVLVGTGASAELVQVDTASVGQLDLKADTPLKFAHLSGEAAVEADVTKLRIAAGNQVDGIPEAVLDIIPLDGSDPIRIYKAFVGEEVELSLQKAEESVMEIPFMGLADTGRAVGDQLFSIGDQSVT